MTLPMKYETPERYIVLSDAFINDRLVKGSTAADPETNLPAIESTVEYDGHPGMNLRPTTDEGRRRQQAYFESKASTPAQIAARTKVLVEGGADLENALGSNSQLAAENAGLRRMVEDLSKRLAPAAPVTGAGADAEPPPTA